MAETERVDKYLIDLIENGNPSKGELLEIIQRWRDFRVSISPIGNPIAKKALEKLKSLNPTVKEIMYLFRLLPRTDCWEMLKNTCFSRGIQHTVIPEEYLWCFIKTPILLNKFVCEEVAKLLLTNFPSKENEKLVKNNRWKPNYEQGKIVDGKVVSC